MDIFKIHSDVVGDYSSYVESFLNISDQRIEEFVRQELIEDKALWPDALIQLNPAYQKTMSVADLVEHGQLSELCADIFVGRDGQSFHLYRHQTEAIERARRGDPYVVTSGTGSGKTMTYFIPIFDAVLRSGKPGVHAIIVYPMNALVNSQEIELGRLASQYEERTGQKMPVTFGAYTGQTGDDQRKEWRQRPPHILLTNYVMLELLLIRGADSALIDPSNPLQFLVLDELHTYRGRQGADVALLVRRLKERASKPNLLTVGTSATMASGQHSEDRRAAVSTFASKLFGSVVTPENVIEETLQPILPALEEDDEVLRTAVQTLPELDSLPLDDDKRWESFAGHPLSSWIENTFGLDQEHGEIRRQLPRSLRQGATLLSEQTGLPLELCERQLQEMLLLGTKVMTPDGNPAFAFKLHQFISQGGSLFATIQKPEERYLTLNGQYYAPGEGERLLYPLVFCRQCGQEYYTVRLGDGQLLPDFDSWRLAPDDTELGLQSGYLMVDPDGRIDPDALPDNWYDARGRLKKTYRAYQPEPMYVTSNGRIATTAESGTTLAWFQPQPLRLCYSCGETHDGHRNEGAKVARLSILEQTLSQLDSVSSASPESVSSIRELRSLIADPRANDTAIADLIQDLVAAAPDTATLLPSLFDGTGVEPGPVTTFVLSRLV